MGIPIVKETGGVSGNRNDEKLLSKHPLFFYCTTMRTLFWVWAFVLSLTVLMSCSGASQITKASQTVTKQSVDSYIPDRVAGFAYRQSFYDSAFAWSTINADLTKGFAKTLSDFQSTDSLNTNSANFSIKMLQILDHELTIIGAPLK